MKKIAIIGAGPAGLTAAYEILKNSDEFEVSIYEKEKVVGGLSKTISFNGNRVDIGGHRLFSKNKRVNETWMKLLSYSDEEMLRVFRSSHILYKGNLYEYPLQINLESLRMIGFFDSVKVVISYLIRTMKKIEEISLEDYYINHFGRKLYSMFFENYTKKLWGISANQLSSDWGPQRIQQLSVKEILKDVFRKPNSNKDRSLIKTFDYPAYGIGQLWNCMRDEIIRLNGSICYQCDVKKISRKTDGYVIQFQTQDKTHEKRADIIISSMPLKDVILNHTNSPECIRNVASRLHYRDMIIVAIEVDKSCMGPSLQLVKHDTWIYLQDINVKFGRIQCLNNWSSKMVNGCESILLELECFCDKNDAIWNMQENDLVNDCIIELEKQKFLNEKSIVKSFCVERISKAYPIYSDGYKSIEQIQEWVDKQNNFYCIGRNGQHHYNNMDHSMETAFAIVDYILGKRKDKKSGWNVNMDQAYNETAE